MRFRATVRVFLCLFALDTAADPNRQFLKTEMFGPKSFQDRVPSESGKPLLRHPLNDEDNVSRHAAAHSPQCFQLPNDDVCRRFA